MESLAEGLWTLQGHEGCGKSSLKDSQHQGLPL